MKWYFLKRFRWWKEKLSCLDLKPLVSVTCTVTCQQVIDICNKSVMYHSFLFSRIPTVCCVLLFLCCSECCSSYFLICLLNPTSCCLFLDIHPRPLKSSVSKIYGVLFPSDAFPRDLANVSRISANVFLYSLCNVGIVSVMFVACEVFSKKS